MKTHIVKIRPDRLNDPLATCFVGQMSSAVFMIGGDIPDDIDTIAVQIGRAPDPTTHQPRTNFAANATLSEDYPRRSFRCYLSPFVFPDVANDLQYHVIGTDTSANPRWLGTGQLCVKDNPANGSPVIPEIIPADTYVRNPVTGLYHLLTAEVNELGEITIACEPEGISR